eukprot:8904905-Pyramimonas_sp.AAC.1
MFRRSCAAPEESGSDPQSDRINRTEPIGERHLTPLSSGERPPEPSGGACRNLPASPVGDRRSAMSRSKRPESGSDQECDQVTENEGKVLLRPLALEADTPTVVWVRLVHPVEPEEPPSDDGRFGPSDVFVCAAIDATVRAVALKVRLLFREHVLRKIGSTGIRWKIVSTNEPKMRLT